MFRTLRSYAVWFASAALAFSLFVPAVTHAAGCTSGSLIKGSGAAVYYCGADGKRYVFPNLKTYSTWYPDFSTVQTITDSELGSIPIGGNVTYRPGVRLIKIVSDPTVYAVSGGGVLHPIASESVASQLYGPDWSSYVDDIPDAFFVNYLLGNTLSDPAQFVRSTEMSDATSINEDKGIANAVVSSGSSAVSFTLSPSVSTLASDQSVTVTASASDPAGVLSLSVFANGVALKTCDQANAVPTMTCVATLSGSSYASGALVSIDSQDLNGSGARHSSSTQQLTIEGGSSAASSLVLSFSPNTTTLAADTPTTVTVRATDPAGISTVAVYVNGQPFQTCGQNGVTTSASCTATLYATNFTSGSTVDVYGQEVNRNGVPTISATTSLTVSSGSAAGDSMTISRSPDSSTLAIGDTTRFIANAYAPHGVADITFFANGSQVQHCNASGANTRATCELDLKGSNYTSGTAVAVYAQGTDTDGTTFISSTSTVTITPGSTVNGTVSLSFSPYVTSLASGQSTTVSVTANDPVGIQTVSVYANGSEVRTCTFDGSITNATCAVSISGSTYSSGSSVAVYGGETNANGSTSISGTSTINVTATASGNGQVTVYLSPASGSISGTQVATVTVNAYDPAGLSSVSVFMNGTNVRSCSEAGTWPTGASCSYNIPASSYSSGTTLSVYGEGKNVNGGTTDSGTSSVYVN